MGAWAGPRWRSGPRAPPSYSPCTATGVPLSVALPLVPSPSSPTVLSPQQNACWLVFSAQAAAPNPSETPIQPLLEKPGTATGVSLIAGVPTEPLPSSPTLLSPQHSTWPVNNVAQTVESLAAMATTPPVSPVTWTGVVLLVPEPLVPSPSSPNRLTPQHSTLPALVIAQVSSSATATCATSVSPVTVTGVLLSLVEPLPSWPWLFCPQHFTIPVISRAQVCSKPAEICAMLAGRPCTSTGTLLLLLVPSPSSP